MGSQVLKRAMLLVILFILIPPAYADGSEKTKMMANDADELFPIWSPAVERIVYESLQAGTSDVWEVDRDYKVCAHWHCLIELEKSRLKFWCCLGNISCS